MKLAVLVLAALTGSVIAGQEPIPPTSLTIDFGGAVLSGAGRVIHATNIPVGVNGSIRYYDADLEFQVLSDGRVAALMTGVYGSTGAATVPSQSVYNFLPGAYRDSSNCPWTLANASIGTDGSRTYSLVKTVAPACQSSNYHTSYAWSTLPPTGPNPFMKGTTSEKALYPGGMAYGQDNDGFSVRTAAVGANISITYYYDSTGNAYQTLSFVHQ